MRHWHRGPPPLQSEPLYAHLQPHISFQCRPAAVWFEVELGVSSFGVVQVAPRVLTTIMIMATNLMAVACGALLLDCATAVPRLTRVHVPIDSAQRPQQRCSQGRATKQ